MCEARSQLRGAGGKCVGRTTNRANLAEQTKKDNMIKQVKNLILFLIFANLQGAFSYTLTPSELKNELNAKIQKELSQTLKNYSTDFNFNITGIPNLNIITNENVKPVIQIENQNLNFNPNSYKRILIKTSNGNLVKSFPINVQTRVYKEVLVASETIPFYS